jgi:hypothetical protein
MLLACVVRFGLRGGKAEAEAKFSRQPKDVKPSPLTYVQNSNCAHRSRDSSRGCEYRGGFVCGCGLKSWESIGKPVLHGVRV